MFYAKLDMFNTIHIDRDVAHWNALEFRDRLQR